MMEEDYVDPAGPRPDVETGKRADCEKSKREEREERPGPVEKKLDSGKFPAPLGDDDDDDV